MSLDAWGNLPPPRNFLGRHHLESFQDSSLFLRVSLSLFLWGDVSWQRRGACPDIIKRKKEPSWKERKRGPRPGRECQGEFLVWSRRPLQSPGIAAVRGVRCGGASSAPLPSDVHRRGGCVPGLPMQTPLARTVLDEELSGRGLRIAVGIQQPHPHGHHEQQDHDDGHHRA